MDHREDDAEGLAKSDSQMLDLLDNKNQTDQEIDFQKSEGHGGDSQRSRPGAQEAPGTQQPRDGNLLAQEKSSLQDDEAVRSPVTFQRLGNKNLGGADAASWQAAGVNSALGSLTTGQNNHEDGEAQLDPLAEDGREQPSQPRMLKTVAQESSSSTSSLDSFNCLSSGEEEHSRESRRDSECSARHDRAAKTEPALQRKNSINADSLKRKKDLLKKDTDGEDQSLQKFQKHLKKLNVFTDLYQSTQDKMITQNIRKSMDERKKDRQSILKIQNNQQLTWWQRILNFRFTPNKGFKLRWDLVIIFLSIYNSFMIPLQFAMPSTMDRIHSITVIDHIVDVLFAIDIMIMFRTSYQDQKTDNIIRDSKLIAINYVKGRFFIDLLASVPFDGIARLITTTPDVRIDPSTTTFLSILKMTRLLRLGRMVSYFQINQAFKFGMKMLQMFLFILIFLNLVACIWIKIFNIIPQDFLELGASSEELQKIYELSGSYSDEDLIKYDAELKILIEKYGYPIQLPEKLKFTLEQYYNSNPFWQYNLMIFMTLFNIMGNDISPTELQIFWVSAALMLTGFLVVSNLIGEFSNILNDIYEADKNNEIEENSEIVGQVLQNMQVPEDIQNRVYEYLEFGTVKTDYVRSQKFFQLISDCQRDIIKMISFESSMRSTGLFTSHNDLSQIKFFIQNMEVHVYLPEDVIVKQNDMADSETEFVYFIIEGCAWVIQERRDFCYFYQDNINHFMTEHEQEDADDEVTQNLELIAKKGLGKAINNVGEKNNQVNKVAKKGKSQGPKSGADFNQELSREIDKQADKQRVRNQKDNAWQDILKQKVQEAQKRNEQGLLNRVLMKKKQKQLDTQKEMILQKFKSMFPSNTKKQKNFVCINEVSESPQKQSYFGEIAAISNLRRTSTLVATTPMLIGKVKISFFKQYYENNTNFRKRVQKHVFTYNDWNMKMIFNMLRNAQLFGSQYAGQHFQQVCLDTLKNLKEESFHHMDCILQLGEVSDRLYFVTQGRVAVFVNMTQDYNQDLVELNENILDEESSKKKREQNRKSREQADADLQSKGAQGQHTNKLLQILNVGSNFNQISAILSQQTIFTYRALGSNCQVASISKQYYEQLCEKHHFIKKLKRFIEEIYNDSGKKYDFQRYTHQNHWANGINVQGLDQNEDEENKLNVEAENEEADAKSKFDQFQNIIQEINKDDYIVESDSEYFSISDVSVNSMGGQNAEGGSAEERQRGATVGDPSSTKKGNNLDKSGLADAAASNNARGSNQTGLERKNVKVGRLLQHQDEDDRADAGSKSAVSKEKDLILQRMKLSPPTAAGKSSTVEKQRKKEELKEQMIMFQLKSNKNWLKISCQLKFKQFIRLITSKVRTDPNFMEKSFKIFTQVDMLQQARLIRMMNLRMIMARQIVVNNSIKLELIEKMNNVTCLAKYRNKNLALNKAILERAKRMQEKEKANELDSRQQQQPARDTTRSQGGLGQVNSTQKQFALDLENQRIQTGKNKSQLGSQNQDLELSPDFVSNDDLSNSQRQKSAKRRFSKKTSQEKLQGVEMVRSVTPGRHTRDAFLADDQQQASEHPARPPNLDAAAYSSDTASQFLLQSNTKFFQNQDTVKLLIQQQQLLVRNRREQIGQLMQCIKQNEQQFKQLVKQRNDRKLAARSKKRKRNAPEALQGMEPPTSLNDVFEHQ